MYILIMDIDRIRRANLIWMGSLE